MSQVFEKSSRLKEVVFDVNLRIDEWRVLFAVDGMMDSLAIAGFLEMQEADVSTALEKLHDMKLLKELDAGAEEAEVEEKAESFEFPETGSEPHEEVDEQPELMIEEEEPEDEAEAQEDIDLDEVISETLEDEPVSLEDTSTDDELDELIGNLLEEEPADLPESKKPAKKVDWQEEPATEVLDADEEIDLEAIFREGDADTDESLSDMLDTLEDETEVAGAEAPPVEEKEFEEVGAPGTILVVDDSVVIRKMVEIALENENYRIVSVASGKEALTYLDENTPDLIILDIMLSDMNGLDVLKAIKASKQIPVVMLSAKDTPRETTKAKQLGADDFIPKPFKDEELVGKIKELIKQ